jgi:hypothetical protein
LKTAALLALVGAALAGLLLSGANLSGLLI